MEAVKTAKWYVIKVIANQEKKMKELIEKTMRLNNLDLFVPRVIIPTEKRLTNVGGKKVIREYVTMPGYLFIEADLTHGEVVPALEKISGMFGFLSMSDGKVTKTPIALRDKEIDRFLDTPSDENNEMTWVKFIVGERVKILDGAFSTFEGIVNQVDEQKGKLTVMVTIFARQTPVEVMFTQAEKIQEKKK